jgi:hypothetical protein
MSMIFHDNIMNKNLTRQIYVCTYVNEMNDTSINFCVIVELEWIDKQLYNMKTMNEKSSLG